ncbi:ComEC/Rec2 family competence protein [Mesorhizobium sp. CAU 1741]|uniref:ComEC/Rec2 family competence protein n=1 Tax=Mesorhizobium sp. CAU 1741 TaxID=3140366 RepID=UPI00325AFA8E
MSLTEEKSADERLHFGASSRTTPADRAEQLPVQRDAPASTLPASAGFHPGTVLARLSSTVVQAFESERDHGALFLFVPVFLALGALVYFSLTSEPAFTPLLLSALVVGVLSLAAHARPALKAGLLALLFTIAGMVAAKLETWRIDTPMLGSEVTTRLTGRVVQIEHQATGRVRLTMDVVATQRPTLRYAPDRVRASARAVPEGLRPGETVEGVVRLMPASGPVRPQSYDFAFYSYFNGIGAVGFFYSNPERSGESPPPDISDRLRASVEDWRLRMAERISGEIGGPEGAIAAALITGVRAGIPEEINEALRIVGLYHVISISGLHMALVGGTVMVVLRIGFALTPTFSSRWPVKKFAAAAALAATAFYLFISGADIAAQRSFMMLGVMLLAVLFDRAALTMRNLAISAIIILLMAPHEVIGPSFQMSFAATAALVAAYAAWTQYRAGRVRSAPAARGPVIGTMAAMMKYGGGLSMTSVVAGAATALFTAWHFQQVSPLGLLANLAAMPFVSVLVMPMAVLASLLMPLGLDGPPLQIMGMGIAAMNRIAFWLADRSAFDATGAIPLYAVLLLTAALAILTMSGTRLRWAAVPLLVAGIFTLVTRDLPDMFVAEDGRLVAVRLSDGRIAVNVDRPRAFVLENWERAFSANDVLKPRDGDPFAETRDPGFICDDRLCLARQRGHVVVYTQDKVAAAQACAYASVIILDDATARYRCGGRAKVLTKRDLARQGSAEVTLSESGGSGSGLIDAPRFSIAEPFRPWHDHRRYSRAARGLAPYKRADD